MMADAMRHGLIAFVACVAFAAPAIAAPTNPEELETQAAMPDAAFRAALAEAVELMQAHDCAGGLALLDPLIERVTGDQRSAVQLLRMPCLAEAGRADELAATHEELRLIVPDNPIVRIYGVILPLQARRLDEAGERLTLLAEQQPAALEALPADVLRAIAQHYATEDRHAELDRLYIALARAGWQPADRPELVEGISAGAVDALLDRGGVEEARTHLDRIASPETLFSMAIDRAYAPLWSEIEARMGPASATVIDMFALEKLEQFTRNPGDPRALRDAVRAFILLGRYEEAIEIAERVAIADGMSEDEIATVRYHGLALVSLGRGAEAAERMRPFAALDPALTPTVASGVVGLAELLDETGAREEALAVSRAALADETEWLSDYGRGWLRRTEICALAGLARRGEAMPLAEALAADSADNEASAIEALLCLGEADRAAAIAIETLATDEGASGLADQFQPDGAIGLPVASYLRALWQVFLERPDVRAAFDAKLRIFPQELWPAAEPRPIPRGPVPEGMPVT